MVWNIVIYKAFLLIRFTSATEDAPWPTLLFGHTHTLRSGEVINLGGIGKTITTKLLHRYDLPDIILARLFIHP